MNKEQINTLKKQYQDVCETYLKEFCEKYEMQYERDSWVAGDVGTVACVADYFFDFNNVIKYAVDENLNDWKELVEWYDYTLFAHEYNQFVPNFKSWHKGCPRLSKREQKKLIDLKRDLETAIKDYQNRY